MAKPTKKQKKNLIDAIENKAFSLYGCDIITIKDLEKIKTITKKAHSKLK